MKSFLVLWGLLAAAVAAPPPAEVPPICLGDARDPVVYGEVWLVANGWGDYPGVLVATIHDGRLEPDLNIEYPECSGWAENCALAVGVAEKALPAGPKVVAAAYGTGPTELSRRFPLWYLSARIEEAERPADWTPALTALGRAEAGGVVLPRPEKRGLQLLYRDGRPLEGARVRVSLFGANNNHCGAALGFPLAEPVSDAQGRIAVTAPGGPLALSLNYYEEQPGGPAGTAYALRTDIVTAAERDITLQRIWTLAQRDYALTVRNAGGQPMAGVRLSGCPWNPHLRRRLWSVGRRLRGDRCGRAGAVARSRSAAPAQRLPDRCRRTDDVPQRRRIARLVRPGRGQRDLARAAAAAGCAGRALGAAEGRRHPARGAKKP